MRPVFLALMAIAMPAIAHAQNLSLEHRRQVIDNLGRLLPQIEFTEVGSPIFDGDSDPFVVRMAPITNSGEPQLFFPGDYTIASSAIEPEALGNHLCHLAKQFIIEERKARANFMDGVDVSAGVGKSEVKFEIGLHERALEGIVRGILYLYDSFAGSDWSFELLVIGAADRAGPNFSRSLDPRAHFDEILAHPPIANDLTQHEIYDRATEKFAIPDPYSNDDLPLLRAEYMKSIFDNFLVRCNLEPRIQRPPRVLRGHPIAETQPEARTVSVYFYVK
ncbi:hypothetical protein [Oricola sp.]|uniref:hypothetical protein n=1 Tax=Oricola sp. TaxID=1979950 RepID=UPI00260039F9|nr:hypothetical protein [Oricola sp.]MCI5077145.1 hypothetical protein [Oricola sp.]